MRVIAGSAKRLLLKTVDGMDTRPTTDRIKETLFNMLQPSLYDCTFLDLYSGSGSIGIEALSRGARSTVFVENNPKAIACIRENLTHTHLEDKAIVMTCDVITALSNMEKQNLRFQIIFMDPPYDNLHEKAVLQYLSHSTLIDEDTIIITEASKETETNYLPELGFALVRTKEYKTNKHLFITKGESKNEDSHLSR